MIGWEDVYKVVVAMVPFYASLALGYGSVRWWHMFKLDHCKTINQLNCYFIMPFYTLEFTAHVNPYQMNYLFLAADVIAKVIVGLVLALWANLSPKGNYDWSVTGFSLASLNNTLVIGVPLLLAMYGEMGADLVIQSSVMQSSLWSPALIFMLEFGRMPRNVAPAGDVDCDITNVSSIETGSTNNEMDQIQIENQNPSTVSTTGAQSFSSLTKTVLIKLFKNPNSYACSIGIIWALFSSRWHVEMPYVLEGTILIMSKAGAGVAMFTMGLFMALQDNVIPSGARLTLLGMVLRLIGGPVSMAIGCLALGLRGGVLRIAIIQAALPQAIASFVFAQEYGLHSQLLSTMVIFGTMISLPLLTGYYVVLESIP